MMISVCMASYNGEKYIAEQLKSILQQIGDNDEVIISDDGSTDKTEEVIRSFNDPRIIFVHNKGTHGFTHNFQNALRLAKGDYIFLSDQDDIWFPNKVEKTMKLFESSDFVISDCTTVNSKFEVIQRSRFEEFNIKNGFFNHLIKSRFLGCCMAFKKKVLEASLPFPKNDFLVEHDIWLAAVALLYFKVELLKEPMIYYRRHGENVSDGGFEKGYSLPVKLKKRIYRLVCLIKIAKKVRNIKKKSV